MFVGKGNNSKLVSEYFKEKEGYVLMPEKEQFSPHFYFKWVQSTGEIDFYSFKEGTQCVNHIPNIGVITKKLELLNTLSELQLELTEKKVPLSPTIDSFMPRTFRLDVMSDEIDFVNHESEGIWIYKPRNLNQGKGIRMIGDIEGFKRELIESKKSHLGQYALNYMLRHRPELDPTKEEPSKESRYSELKQDGLIQQYISPLLLSKRKFDIRCFLFLTTQPYLALFNEGYLRLTLHDYTEQDLES